MSLQSLDPSADFIKLNFDILNVMDTETLIRQIFLGQISGTEIVEDGVVIYPSRNQESAMSEKEVTKQISDHFEKRNKSKEKFILSDEKNRNSNSENTLIGSICCNHESHHCYQVYFGMGSQDFPNLKYSWSESFANFNDKIDPTLNQLDSNLRYSAFLSYKGGVGRTTALLCAARSILEDKQNRVLIVDLDTDAPGLTLDFGELPNGVSVLDILQFANEIEFESSELPLEIENRIEFNRIMGSSHLGQLFFIPFFRYSAQDFWSGVRNQNYVYGNGFDPFLMAINLVAQKLKVTHVLFDLRTGLSDSNASIALHPEIDKIVVSSRNNQSIIGCSQMLERLKIQKIYLGESDRERGGLSLVLNQVPESHVGQPLPPELTAASRSVNEVEVDSFRESIVEVDFDQNLFSPFLNFDNFLFETIQNSKMYKSLNPWFATHKGSDSSEDAEEAQVESGLSEMVLTKTQTKPPLSALELLKLECTRQLFAESEANSSFLLTPQIAALSQDLNSNSQKVIVVLGNKGAGKSYLWKSLMDCKNVKTFVARCALSPRASLFGESANATEILNDNREFFPLTYPINLNDKSRSQYLSCEDSVIKKLQSNDSHIGKTQSFSDAKQILNPSKMQTNIDEAGIWLKFIASRLGRPDQLANEAPEIWLAKVDEKLIAKKQSLVFLMDGIEEIFGTPDTEPEEKAGRKLLKFLLQELEDLLKTRNLTQFSFVILPRKDMASAAIRQNFGHFENRYKRFELTWKLLDALRLAAWVANRAGYKLFSKRKKDFYSLSSEELQSDLEKLWGQKMGSDISKEAYTYRWVIASLSDFNGNLQARDLVRLLNYAADFTLKESTSNSAKAQILTPKALKEALKSAAKDKRIELVKELVGIKKIIDKFDAMKSISIPFKASKVGIQAEELEQLQRLGIATSFPDSPLEIYLPEIIWRGMPNAKFEALGRTNAIRLYKLVTNNAF